MPVATEVLRAALAQPLERTEFSALGQRFAGKVRDTYRRTTSAGDDQLLIITTDRASAFDQSIGTLPFKGQVLTRCASWWFRDSAAIVPNHLLAVPDPNAMLCVACEPLPVEFVVRAYLTGTTSTSILVHYAAGERDFCGHRLPDGLRPHQALPTPLLTPSSKAADGGHDVSMSRRALLDAGVLGAADFDAAADYAMAMFAHGQRRCAERGLLLVDTKYEFGKTADGRLLLIDEAHTPDSSRFWYADSYEASISAGEAPRALDKEYLRRWLSEHRSADGALPPLPDDIRLEAARRYIEACERLCGEPFVPDTTPPLPRLRRNLGLD